MTSTKARKHTPGPTARRRSLLWPGVAALGTVALILAVVFSLEGESDVDDGAQTGSPAVTGEALPRFDAAAPTAGLGMAMPEVEGAGFDGTAAAITANGSPKAIVFLAHWCPHCQAEVPVVQGWLDGGGLPEGAELIAVSTGVDPARDNYPPQAWLEAEGWSAPVIVDSGDGDVANAFGLSAFPFWVLVDGDGTVVARTTGAIDITAVGEALASMAG